jgi:hypothetical protein
MIQIVLILIITLLSASCAQNISSEDHNSNAKSLEETFAEEPTFRPLTPGEVYINEGSFGEIIELKGISMPVEEIFRVSETQMLVQDSFLIVRNRYMDDQVMVYTLPGLQFLHSFGRAGKGPEEFQFPQLIQSRSKDVLCYIYELTQNKLYSVNREFHVNEMNFDLPKTSDSRFSSKEMENINDSTFVFVESTSKGKEIFSLNIDGSSSHTEQIYNLSFKENIRSWAAYKGDFGINPNKNRMVYAYKYFRQIEFIDTESLESTTVIFDDPARINLDLSDVLGPHNITHYWGLSAQKDYVYILYSGRTPVEVHNENLKSSGHIYVEQFDWNGNPIRKFKLDRWGYFCIDESENTLYLISTIDEHPFYKFKLPDIVQLP